MEILVHNLSHADLIVKISDGVPSPSGVHEYKVRPHIHGISVPLLIPVPERRPGPCSTNFSQPVKAS